MIIRSAKFVKSSPSLKECPRTSCPEFGLIGRSNVGKSSLINMLTGWSKLAKTSGEPGKTRYINHYLVNDRWYLVDLPGYGYARVPATQRAKWARVSRDYILKREKLLCLFVLIDSRHEPQKSDTEFMSFLDINRVPFARIFTKSDKTGKREIESNIRLHDKNMLQYRESLPATFVSSSVLKTGRDDILCFIEEHINKLSTSPSYRQE
jgi:GTP-binding protein